mmetsp:Transcript_12526/g.23794  ORF Transcript_12526/g.23794 Transcript_12526/m.23794 type:complete len:380 (-) Transcript_12526:559-1698(-)
MGAQPGIRTQVLPVLGIALGAGQTLDGVARSHVREGERLLRCARGAGGLLRRLRDVPVRGDARESGCARRLRPPGPAGDVHGVFRRKHHLSSQHRRHERSHGGRGSNALRAPPRGDGRIRAGGASGLAVCRAGHAPAVYAGAARVEVEGGEGGGSVGRGCVDPARRGRRALLRQTHARGVEHYQVQRLRGRQPFIRHRGQVLLHQELHAQLQSDIPAGVLLACDDCLLQTSQSMAGHLGGHVSASAFVARRDVHASPQGGALHVRHLPSDVPGGGVHARRAPHGAGGSAFEPQVPLQDSLPRSKHNQVDGVRRGCALLIPHVRAHRLLWGPHGSLQLAAPVPHPLQKQRHRHHRVRGRRVVPLSFVLLPPRTALPAGIS